MGVCLCMCTAAKRYSRWLFGDRISECGFVVLVFDMYSDKTDAARNVLSYQLKHCHNITNTEGLFSEARVVNRSHQTHDSAFDFIRTKQIRHPNSPCKKTGRELLAIIRQQIQSFPVTTCLAGPDIEHCFHVPLLATFSNHIDDCCEGISSKWLSDRAASRYSRSIDNHNSLQIRLGLEVVQSPGIMCAYWPVRFDKADLTLASRLQADCKNLNPIRLSHSDKETVPTWILFASVTLTRRQYKFESHPP